MFFFVFFFVTLRRGERGGCFIKKREKKMGRGYKKSIK
jgi:hypothetical protein